MRYQLTCANWVDPVPFGREAACLGGVPRDHVDVQSVSSWDNQWHGAPSAEMTDSGRVTVWSIVHFDVIFTIDHTNRVDNQLYFLKPKLLVGLAYKGYAKILLSTVFFSLGMVT